MSPIAELLKNGLLFICLAFWLLPLSYVKLSALLQKLRIKMNKKDSKNKGKDDFKVLKEIKEINKSPTPNEKLSRDKIKAKLAFCKKELLIHRENQNNIMIGFKTAEIKDLEKKL